MEPLITVIIPIYNMEAYLSRCLDSVHMFRTSRSYPRG